MDESAPLKLSDYMNVFMLHVPNRLGGGFPLRADTAESKEKWISLLSKVIAESIGSPDQSIASSSYEEEEDDVLYSS